MAKWGFLGTGRVTHRMLDAVCRAEDATLAGVASREKDRAQAWIDERRDQLISFGPNVPVAYSSYQCLLNDTSIDWVYIALPPSLHREWTIAALEAGKHVLCEKPLCVNASEAKEVAAVASKKQRRLYHATAFPFHPRSTSARQLIKSDELRGIKRIHVACSFAGIVSRGNDHRMNVALGGGCLLDLGWYCVYSTLWFTGLKCHRVRAIGKQQDGVWLQVQVLAEMSNGAVAHWDCGFDAAPRRWIEIAGSDASWICDDFLRPLDLAKPRYWIHGQEGKTTTTSIGEGVFQETRMIEACQLPCDLPHAESEQLQMAIDTHHILDCIELAAASGKEVVIDQVCIAQNQQATIDETLKKQP